RTRPEVLFGAERIVTNDPLPGAFTTRDHDGFDRVDDPATPNVGVGTDPFFDIGAFDLRDLLAPILRSFTISVASDTGEQNESQPFVSRQNQPTFYGTLTDNTNDVDGLLVDLDLDGDGLFNDGTALTRIVRSPAGNPIFL